jgi:Trk K+ transport system NAD-binding subunit
VSLVRRNGELVEIHGGTELLAGDEVLIIGGADVKELFGPPWTTRDSRSHEK